MLARAHRLIQGRPKRGKAIRAGALAPDDRLWQPQTSLDPINEGAHTCKELGNSSRLAQMT
jgi:hypothetical protein